MDDQNLYDLGIIGLGAMGSNLAINFLKHNYSVALHDKDLNKLQIFTHESNEDFIKCNKIELFISKLKSPRKILIMIPAGKLIDELLESLIPKLSENDLIIDGGNSFYKDTIRRKNLLEKHSIQYVGLGVSGGSEGALNGPSLMVGCSDETWSQVKSLLDSIAAKSDGISCNVKFGTDGAGHFVKMVHNGIEYAMMECIAEIYDIFSIAYGMTSKEIKLIFDKWKIGKLSSYLIEISANILGVIDLITQQPILDVIRDEASQKGTGAWTGLLGLEWGIPIPTIISAVQQRSLSSNKDRRVKLSSIHNMRSARDFKKIEQIDISNLEDTLYLSFLISYIQGIHLLLDLSSSYSWEITIPKITTAWKNGCIIRSNLLQKLSKLDLNTSLLLESDELMNEIKSNYAGIKYANTLSLEYDIPIPGISSVVNYLLSNTSAKLPMNLIQAQRDYFGSHGFKRNDSKSTSLNYIDWINKSG